MSFTLRDNFLTDWNVLLVDDEVDSLFVATRLLQIYGAKVITAENGRNGLALARQHAAQLNFIISDLSMPEMDGWMLIEALKQNRATVDIPVIALTAHAMPGDRQKAITAGFHNYLSKPLSPETFVSDLMVLLMDIPEIAAQLNQA